MKKSRFLKQLNLRFSKNAIQTDGGIVLIPDNMYLTKDFIKSFLNSDETDELVDSNTLEFLERHFKIKHLLTFDINSGMGASSDNLVILKTDNTYSYLIYDFSLNGELWILAAFTNSVSNVLINEIVYSLMSRQGNLKEIPFQILYGLPNRIQNYAPDVISSEQLQNAFFDYYNHEENMTSIKSDADTEFYLLCCRIKDTIPKQNKYSDIERKKIIVSYFDLYYEEYLN